MSRLTRLETVIDCINADSTKRRALIAAASLGLPDWLIAAGFVRNAIWDRIYNRQTCINDIDVIYYCRLDNSKERDRILEAKLTELEPGLPWSVKNQARMHARNGDEEYSSTLDAMRHWPEKQTAIGAKLDECGIVEVHHCFDISLQFNGKINHNPLRAANLILKRVHDKKWLQNWPELKVELA